jgi:hypothetical protein
MQGSMRHTLPLTRLCGVRLLPNAGQHETHIASHTIVWCTAFAQSSNSKQLHVHWAMQVSSKGSVALHWTQARNACRSQATAVHMWPS